MQILSKRLSNQLTKETLAFKTLWLYSMVSCLFDDENIILFTSDVLQVALLSRNSMVHQWSTYFSRYPEATLLILWRYRITVLTWLSYLLACKGVVCVIDKEILGRRLSTVRLCFDECDNQIYSATPAKRINWWMELNT